MVAFNIFDLALLKHKRLLCRASIAGALMVLFSACTPIVDTRGHVETNTTPEDIKVSTSTRDDVLKMLGSPSSTSNFGDETWYYINARKERMAFFKPEVKDQHVMRIIFDKEGVVSKIDNFSQADAQQLHMVEETTPTEGHKLGVVEQIVGNLGRFNKDKKGGGASPVGNPGRPY